MKEDPAIRDSVIRRGREDDAVKTEGWVKI